MSKQLSVPVTTYDIGNYFYQNILVGNSIYFANYSSTAKSQFFVRYDIASNTFSSPSPNQPTAAAAAPPASW